MFPVRTSCIILYHHLPKIQMHRPSVISIRWEQGSPYMTHYHCLWEGCVLLAREFKKYWYFLGIGCLPWTGVIWSILCRAPAANPTKSKTRSTSIQPKPFSSQKSNQIQPNLSHHRNPTKSNKKYKKTPKKTTKSTTSSTSIQQKIKERNTF